MQQNSSNNCFNCKLSYPKYFEISKNKYCYFCKLIYFMEQKDIFSIHIGYSTMQQEEIIKKTKEILKSENRIPTNKDIDKNSKLVLINPYILTNLIKLMSTSEQVCFSNIRIFFSEDIDTDYIKIKRMIDKPKPIIKSNLIPEKIALLPHQKVIFDKYYIKFI
jgi:hypothetical protein